MISQGSCSIVFLLALKIIGLLAVFSGAQSSIGLGVPMLHVLLLRFCLSVSVRVCMCVYVILVYFRCRNLRVPLFYTFSGPPQFACFSVCVLCSFGWQFCLAGCVQNPGLRFYRSKMFYHIWAYFQEHSGAGVLFRCSIGWTFTVFEIALPLSTAAADQVPSA